MDIFTSCFPRNNLNNGKMIKAKRRTIKLKDLCYKGVDSHSESFQNNIGIIVSKTFPFKN